MALNPNNYMYPNATEQRLMAMQQQNPQLTQQYNMAYPYQPPMQPSYNSQMMQPQQQYMGQQQMPMQQQSIIFECRPVTSIDEAKAMATKWDGSPTICVDSANKCIYEKKLNPLDGTAIFNTYNLNGAKPIENINEKVTESTSETMVYVDKKEFDALQEKVILLTANHKKLYDELMGDVDNGNKSDADNADASRKWQSNGNASKYGKK